MGKFRRKILIDKGFQLKVTLSIVGIFVLIISIILAAMSLAAYYNNAQMDVLLIEQKTLISTQNELFDSLAAFAHAGNLRNLRISVDSVREDHKRSIQRIDKNIKMIRQITRINRLLTLSLLILIIPMGIFLSYVFVLRTHRISGPIFLLKRYFANIIQGEYPQVRPLRKKDDFQDLFALFTEMTKTLEQREKEYIKRIAELEKKKKNV